MSAFIQHKNWRPVLILVSLLLIAGTNMDSCKCPSSSSSSYGGSGGSYTPPPPPNPTLYFQNLYGVAVSVEVYRGEELEYREGRVYGTTLLQTVFLTNVNNGSTADLGTIPHDKNFILVIGVDDGGNTIYITNLVVNNYKTTKTFTLQSSGVIN